MNAMTNIYIIGDIIGDLTTCRYGHLFLPELILSELHDEGFMIILCLLTVFVF